MARSNATPLRAGLRSLVLPGWGQLAGDRPIVGWTLIVASLCLGAAAVGAATRLGVLELAARLAQPDVLLGILAANVALAVARLVVCTHAWRSGGGHGWAAAIFLAVLVVAPHALIGWAGGPLATRFSPCSPPHPPSRDRRPFRPAPGPPRQLPRPDGYHVPDVERIREAVHRTITEPVSAADLGVTTAPDACG